MERYERQLLIPGWGPAAQQRLKRATVAVAGAGGLGCAVLPYLAAAGVGRIVIVDRDVVSLSNLNRQVLYGERDLGSPKATLAARRLEELNPEVTVTAAVEEISEASAPRLFGSADILVDALDNWPTRGICNRVALRRGIPFVHAAVWGWEGRVTTIVPGVTGCLRCIFPQGGVPEGGTDGGPVPVVGVTPGVLGILEAAEALKHLTGTPEPLAGVLLVVDLTSMQVRRLATHRDPSCPECGRM